MIVDLHNHVWPDEIAARALGASIPEMPLCGDGTVAGLIKAQDEAGVRYSVCFGVANTAKQVEPANAFVGSLDRERFVPFGTVHPDLTPEQNVEVIERHGVAGLKLHPIFQRFSLDDERLRAALEAVDPRLPITVHIGSGAGADGSACTPTMLRDLVLALPDHRFISCHLGGYHMPEQAEALVGLPLWFDTSWPPSLASQDPGRIRDVIRRHGVERILYASDWPTASPLAEVQAVRDLGLDDDETAAVLGGNAAALLGLA